MREFIRSMLSDKQVCYSRSYASLLDITMNHSYSNDVAEIDSNLTAEYEKKCKGYEQTIAQLEEDLKRAREAATPEEPEETPSVTSQDGETAESSSDPENEPQEAPNEATEPTGEEQPTATESKD